MNLHAFGRHYSNTNLNFSKPFFQFSSDKMTLCNNNDQTLFSYTLTSARPLRVLKTLTFQAQVLTSPSGPADVNAKENMFDPYIATRIAKTV